MSEKDAKKPLTLAEVLAKHGVKVKATSKGFTTKEKN